MREVGVARIQLDGDEETAASYISQARTELGILKQSMKMSQLKQLSRTVNLADETTITVSSVHGQDTIFISVPLVASGATSQSPAPAVLATDSFLYFYRVTGLQAVAPIYNVGRTVGANNGTLVVVNTAAQSRPPLVLASVKRLLPAARTDVVERFCNVYFGDDSAISCDQGFLLDKTKVTANLAALPKFDTVFAGFLGTFDHTAFVAPVAGPSVTLLPIDYSGRLDRWYTSYVTGGSSISYTLGLGDPNGAFGVTDSTTTIGGAIRVKYRRGFTGWAATVETLPISTALSQSAQAAGHPTNVVIGNTSSSSAIFPTAIESYGQPVITGQQAWNVFVTQDNDGAPHAGISYSGGITVPVAADYVIARYLTKTGDSFLAYRSGRLAINVTVPDANKTPVLYVFDQVVSAALPQDGGGLIVASGGSRANSLVNYGTPTTNYLAVSLTGFLAVIPHNAPVYADDWVGPPVVWSDIGCLYDPVSGNFAFVKYLSVSDYLTAQNQFFRKLFSHGLESGTAAQYRDLALASITVLVNTGLPSVLLLATEPGQLVLMV